MKKDKHHHKFQLLGLLGYGILISVLIYFKIPWWGWVLFAIGFILVGTMASHNIRKKILRDYEI